VVPNVPTKRRSSSRIKTEQICKNAWHSIHKNVCCNRGLVLNQTLLGLLEPIFVLNVGNHSHNDTLSHSRRLATSIHLLQYSPHMQTADQDQYNINRNNKCTTRIQRGLNCTPSGQRNVQYPREVGKATNAYGMKSTLRPGGRSIVKEWVCALLD
jgi:hypothetical protein